MRPALVALLPLAAGCADWPRAAHLVAETGMVSSEVDPRELVEVDFEALDEVAGNDSTVQAVAPLALAPGGGGAWTGSLEGAGWVTNPSQGLTSGACPGVVGHYLPPEEEGDYYGDLDFSLVTPGADATLCARVETEPDARLGLDVLLLDLDSCSLPADHVEYGGEVVGYNLAGPVAEWGVPVVADHPLAVLVAGYGVRSEDGSQAVHSDDSFVYRVGLSLVPTKGGEPGLCPLLPVDSR